MAEPIYKIASKADWEAAWVAGELKGTAVDLADGYIHFSTAEQLAETLDKHYRGQSGLVLATIDPDLLPHPLKWEPSRGGALFPHLYAPLPMAAVIAERPLDARGDGGFDLPEID
ncbi:DUF952 domain-containing protein [Pelagibacterium xiamenense]|uniref:DUF952 domain-containing protein n=1 Tax=Pelagibacterium xiamenense TaxID=2901140 RepID=UPI001E532524|nr:DUF952 domain-containing protein [Pelagibacterium xiamenense]MCD7059069.1 DUF952 domain-containing protein [Pelagibacterium xiamenense]